MTLHNSLFVQNNVYMTGILYHLHIRKEKKSLANSKRITYTTLLSRGKQCIYCIQHKGGSSPPGHVATWTVCLSLDQSYSSKPLAILLCNSIGKCGLIGRKHAAQIQSVENLIISWPNTFPNTAYQRSQSSDTKTICWLGTSRGISGKTENATKKKKKEHYMCLTQHGTSHTKIAFFLWLDYCWKHTRI